MWEEWGKFTPCEDMDTSIPGEGKVLFLSDTSLRTVCCGLGGCQGQGGVVGGTRNLLSHPMERVLTHPVLLVEILSTSLGMPLPLQVLPSLLLVCSRQSQGSVLLWHPQSLSVTSSPTGYPCVGNSHSTSVPQCYWAMVAFFFFLTNNQNSGRLKLATCSAESSQ